MTASAAFQPCAYGEAARTGETGDTHLLNLTLRDCIDIAFQKSVMRGVSQDSIKIAEAQRSQALSANWPQLKLSMTAMRWDETPNFVFYYQPLTFDVKLMDRDLLTSTLSLIYPLYVGGKLSALQTQAKAGAAVSREEARRTDLQIVKDVKQYYYGHILAKKIHELGRETLERFEATEALTESLYQAGSGKVKKTDYLRNKMMTSTLRSVIEQMKSGEELSRSALANTMGLAWTTQIAVAEGDIPFQPYSGVLDGLVEKARQFNPQMMQVRLGLEAREAKIKEAKSGHLPIVAFFGDYTRLDNSYDGGITTDVNKKSWRIGLTLELPIFNGFRASSEVREARHRLEKLKKESLLLNEGLALMVKNAFLQIAGSQGQVMSLKEAVAMATENRELNERAYQQEMVETKDVIEAQLMEFVMNGLYLKALYEFQTHAGELEFIIGTSVYENR
jgi:outer membrane protein TolC